MNEKWSESYHEFIGRNIGILTRKQQEILHGSTIVVFGVGGVGSPAFEVLVRAGVGHFKIVDKDIFDASNMNRQIYAFTDTIGRKKVDVTREFALKINPEIQVDCFDTVEEDNIAEILNDVDVAVLAIDELKPCLISSRKARQMNIPLVEGWALPFGNVRVITSDTSDLETAYGLPTRDRHISDISDDEFRKFGLDVLLGLGDIEGIAAYFSDDAIEKIMQGHITSFAPMAWLTSVFLATEALKVLLGWGNIAKGPDFTLYDPFSHCVPKMKPGQE